MSTTFDSQTLADDLTEIHRTYSRFSATRDESSWDKPAKGGPIPAHGYFVQRRRQA